MTDLDYAKVMQRVGLTVGDGLDPDETPDTIWCDAGTVQIEPLNTYVKVADGTPVPWTGGNAVIECSVSDATFADPTGNGFDGAGYLLFNGKPYVWVVDLTSSKVNPSIPEGATHRITYLGVTADGTAVSFPSVEVRLTAAGDGTSPNAFNDLTLLSPIEPGAAVPIFRGEQGTSVQAASIDPTTGDLLFTLNDSAATELNAGPIPVTEAATTAAADADASATTATAAASTATTKAGEASSSAGAAATAKTDAETASTTAQSAKTGAETAQAGAEAARDDLLAQKGAASGIAPLGADSKLPEAHVPDRLSAASLSASIADVGGTQFAPAVVATGDDFDLTGTTDCTAALKTLIASAQAFGAKYVRGVPGATYRIALPQSDTLGTITTDGMVIDFSGCTIDNSAAIYTADALTPWFIADGALGVTVKVGRALGYELPDPATHHGYRGATFVRAINGAKGITVECLDIHNFRYGVQSGEYGDPTKGGCSGFKIRLRGSMIGYPIATYLADDGQVDIDVDGVHRAFYLGGSHGWRGRIAYRDQYIADTVFLMTDSLLTGTDAAAQADPVGAATTSRGIEDVDMTVIDKGSTVFTNSTSLAGITLSRVDPVTFRNIRVRGYAGSPVGGVSQRVGLFKIASGAKAIWSRYAYNWEPTIVMENITISGSIDHSAQTGDGNTAGDIFVRAYDTTTAHAATIRGFAVEDAVLKPSPGNTRALYLEAPGLSDTGALFNRVAAAGHTLNLQTNGATATTFRKTTGLVVNLSGVTGGSRVEQVDSALTVTDSVTGNTAAITNLSSDGASTLFGASDRVVTRHYLIPLSGAGTATWTNALPAGAIVQGVSGRVVTAITGTGVTGFAVGVSGDVGRYYNANNLAAGTTFTRFNANSTGQMPHFVGSTTSIVVTARTAGGPDGASPFTGGTLRLVVKYLLATAPTS